MTPGTWDLLILNTWVVVEVLQIRMIWQLVFDFAVIVMDMSPSEKEKKNERKNLHSKNWVSHLYWLTKCLAGWSHVWRLCWPQYTQWHLWFCSNWRDSSQAEGCLCYRIPYSTLYLKGQSIKHNENLSISVSYLNLIKYSRFYQTWCFCSLWSSSHPKTSSASGTEATAIKDLCHQHHIHRRVVPHIFPKM